MPVLRRTALSLAAAGALAAWPAAAAAEVTFTFQGRGFGHGVGMGQYGARGAALEGLGMPQILRHYYRGAELSTVSPEPLRVRVAEGVSAISLRSSSAMSVRTGTGIPRTVPAGSYVVRRAGEGVRLMGSGGSRILHGAAPLRANPGSAGALTIAGTRFRGALSAHPAGSGLDAVNVVDLEAYLRGVLPREVPASWGEETPAALDAQAVAARSYALASRRSSGHFDLHADVRSQVYGGIDGEASQTNAAVGRTRGRVLTHGGDVVPAYYSSSTGGRTESVEHAWGGEPRPYLRSVPDPYDSVSPYHRSWPDPVTVSAAELGEKLDLGEPVRSVDITERGDSPRVKRLRVTGVRGATATPTGDRMRAELGLRSTWFSVTRRGEPEADPGGRIRLTAAQLRINQRISQAAVRRINEVIAHLNDDPPPERGTSEPGRIRLTAAQLRINQRISQAAVRRVNAVRARLDGDPPPEAGDSEPGRIRLSAAQLRINQRISQAAVRRVNAIREELDLDEG